MTASFERNFKDMIAHIRHGHFNEHKIDFRDTPITKKHVHDLADALAENFRVAKNITEIDLAFTNLDELPEHIFKDCDSLRILNIDNNKLKKLPSLPDRPYALQDFFAGNNPLKKIADNYFANCVSLKAVYLNDTQIKEVPHLDDSLSLAWLHLNSNPIQQFPQKFFKYLQHLDTIFIQNTNLKELPNLSHCKKLHEVWIDDIHVPARHIAATAQIVICKTEQ